MVDSDGCGIRCVRGNHHRFRRAVINVKKGHTQTRGTAGHMHICAVLQESSPARTVSDGLQTSDTVVSLALASSIVPGGCRCNPYRCCCGVCGLVASGAAAAVGHCMGCARDAPGLKERT